MEWLRRLLRGGRKSEVSEEALAALREKFSRFRALLDRNNEVLKLVADMEEKAGGDYLFDINYIRSALAKLEEGVGEIVEHLIALGGDRYAVLRDRFRAIEAEIHTLLDGGRPVREDSFTIPFELLGSERAWSVGSKSAQLGEMLSKLRVPVPPGFAVSAWAYKHFLDANDLQRRISERISRLDITRYEDLADASEQIRAMVSSSPVPDDLAQAVRESHARLRQGGAGERVALRSSAIGEDTLLSFAGQYATFLNVRAEEIVERYRDVLAGKFTPKAIYYLLSHALSESDLAMGVACMAMVDARASGVVYTRDPVRPEDECLVISSIYGLGPYLVDGTLTPDVFKVSRRTLEIEEARLARKPRRLAPRPDGGTFEEPVPEHEQNLPAVQEEHLATLARYALRIEEHYGTAQDIEWALDQQGRIWILQARPLRLLERQEEIEMPDMSCCEVLISGGATVCPGAGEGPVFHAVSARDLSGVPAGAVLVAPSPFPGLVTAMDKISALVTEAGSTASHMATLAREYRVPTIVGASGACSLPRGAVVTVDADERRVYAGSHPELVRSRRKGDVSLGDMAVIRLLGQVLGRVSPLNLVNPADRWFLPERCATLHDITRFAHQKAMEEMFFGGTNLAHKERLSARLKSEIPLDVLVIHLDRDLGAGGRRQRVLSEAEIDSIPLKALWEGIRQEGWPSRQRPANFKGFMTVMTRDMSSGSRGEFAENSFAIVSKEYMILSLRMGYHFTTIEAMCTEEASKNYIRMQFKGGGASLDRRMRRIKLVTDILSLAGFEHLGKGDFLDTRVSYLDAARIAERLRLLGRLTMMTKQLDMALSSDAVAQWYTEDFMRRLGLGPAC